MLKKIPCPSTKQNTVNFVSSSQKHFVIHFRGQLSFRKLEILPNFKCIDLANKLLLRSLEKPRNGRPRTRSSVVHHSCKYFFRYYTSYAVISLWLTTSLVRVDVDPWPLISPFILGWQLQPIPSEWTECEIWNTNSPVTLTASPETRRVTRLLTTWG